jgi:hypothetical protein
VSTFALNATHLQIAARMQVLLDEWLGEPFDVARMLADEHEQREVLFVCQASNHPELMLLARQFVAAGRPMPAIAAPAATVPSIAATQHPPAHPALPVLSDMIAAPVVAAPAPQDAAWSRNTSGFGLTEVPPAEASDLRALDATPSAETPQRTAGVRPRWLQRPKWLRRELQGN